MNASDLNINAFHLQPPMNARLTYNYTRCKVLCVFWTGARGAHLSETEDANIKESSETQGKFKLPMIHLWSKA